MTDPTNIGITFGALAPNFREQEIAQFIGADACERYQFLSDAISRLRIEGLLTDSAAKAARDKLYKRMVKAARAAYRKMAA